MLTNQQLTLEGGFVKVCRLQWMTAEYFKDKHWAEKSQSYVQSLSLMHLRIKRSPQNLLKMDFVHVHALQMRTRSSDIRCWMSSCVVTRRDKWFPVHQNSTTQHYPVSPAGSALISPAWRANKSLTTKTRCAFFIRGLMEEEEDQHLTFV